MQAKAIEKLAQQIAGARRDRSALELARAAASAAFELARVRQVKAHLVKGVSVLGSIDLPPFITSRRDELRYLKLALRTNASPPPPPDPSTTMRSDAAARVAEAERRALPELARLDRYEARAINRRDRAIRALINSSLD
ncbi:hypothetical protein QIH93_08435 [Bradyrhizobium ottawaense]|uniref:hypothetical protein n=1 Tax=Bradyrhizobium ottawaense TaxID=931866 RepID=UPI0027154C42|nr:hypothetical protein [Bradyrhizobium ottawaense]WLB47986.1 hypothetical protein QIH93_08435 [Bradyrhizobium ottawaense]